MTESWFKHVQAARLAMRLALLASLAVMLLACAHQPEALQKAARQLTGKPAASQQKAHGPVIQHWTTANGMRVYFVPAPELPMLDIRINFSAGSARDGDAPGLARLTNAMLPQGADGMDADAIARAFEDVGAQFGNGSLRDMAWLSLRSLSDPAYLEPALKTFTRILWKPDFPKGDYQRLIKQTLISLEAQKAQPGSIAQKAFFKALYGDHPYATPSIGTEESVKKLTLARLRDFYRQYYVAANGLIAITGDIDRKGAEKLAERLSSGLKRGRKPAPIPPVKPLEKGQRITIPFPSTQAHILIGSIGIERGNPDYYALYLANHPLGGNGLSSRLSKEIREKRGFVYSIYSYFSPMAGPGPYIIGLQTRGSQTKEALKLTLDEIRKYREEGPTDEEITASKRNITGSFPLRIASNADIVQYLAVIGFYGLPLDYLDTFNGKIEAIDKPTLIDAYRRHVDPDKFVTVIVGGEKG